MWKQRLIVVSVYNANAWRPIGRQMSGARLGREHRVCRLASCHIYWSAVRPRAPPHTPMKYTFSFSAQTQLTVRIILYLRRALNVSRQVLSAVYTVYVCVTERERCTSDVYSETGEFYVAKFFVYTTNLIKIWQKQRRQRRRRKEREGGGEGERAKKARAKLIKVVQYSFPFFRFYFRNNIFFFSLCRCSLRRRRNDDAARIYFWIIFFRCFRRTAASRIISIPRTCGFRDREFGRQQTAAQQTSFRIDQWRDILISQPHPRVWCRMRMPDANIAHTHHTRSHSLRHGIAESYLILLHFSLNVFASMVCSPRASWSIVSAAEIFNVFPCTGCVHVCCLRRGALFAFRKIISRISFRSISELLKWMAVGGGAGMEKMLNAHCSWMRNAFSGDCRAKIEKRFGVALRGFIWNSLGCISYARIVVGFISWNGVWNLQYNNGSVRYLFWMRMRVIYVRAGASARVALVCNCARKWTHSHSLAVSSHLNYFINKCVQSVCSAAAWGLKRWQ